MPKTKIDPKPEKDTDIKEAKSTKKSSKSKDKKTKKEQEETGGRYWGIIFLLITIVLSLVFYFFR